MKLFLFLSALLFGCSGGSPTSPSGTTTTEPAAVSSTASSTSTSTTTSVGVSLALGEKRAVDYVGAAPQSFYDGMKRLGVHTIIRYYDWKNESLRGKTPTQEELAAIKRNGFRFMAIFQHLNNRESTFTSARGVTDAKRVLELATAWGQPRGSAVYFGVDGDFPTTVPPPYFKSAAPIIRAAGYRVGMYGSGANCENLAALQLIDKTKSGTPLCWIAASSWGWRGTKAVLAKGKGYVLAQTVNQTFAGKSVDWNKVLDADFGSWELR